MKILRASDRVQIKINNLKIIVQPLTYGKRLEMGKFISIKDGKEMHNYADSMMFLVKNTVKEIHLEDEKIDLEIKDGQLTDESMTDVMGLLEGNTEAYKDITLISANAGKPIPKIVNPETGEAIEGVEITVLPKA